MIVHLFLVVAGHLVAWLLAATAVLNLGDFAGTLAGYTTSVAGWMGTLFADLASMGAWLPTSLLAALLLLVVTAIGVAFALRFALMVLSLFTGGGGR